MSGMKHEPLSAPRSCAQHDREHKQQKTTARKTVASCRDNQLNPTPSATDTAVTYERDGVVVVWRKSWRNKKTFAYAGGVCEKVAHAPRRLVTIVRWREARRDGDPSSRRAAQRIWSYTATAKVGHVCVCRCAL